MGGSWTDCPAQVSSSQLLFQTQSQTFRNLATSRIEHVPAKRQLATMTEEHHSHSKHTTSTDEDESHHTSSVGNKVASHIPGTDANKASHGTGSGVGSGTGSGYGSGSGSGSGVGPNSTSGPGATGTQGYGNQGSAGQKVASAVPGTQANQEKKTQQGTY